MPNPAEIRIAELADAPAIARLVNDAFRPERFFSTMDRTDPGKVSALFQKGQFFTLFEDGALAGCVYTELRGERGYFGLLAVDPQRQRSGIGARLIAAAEQHCRSNGCRFMDLTFVNVRQDLPTYYRQFGYVESGTLPFPTDQVTRIPVHLVQMSKPL
ncbi:MAG TPA: GNAT family N-acetyltransferase [Terriglobales bacterium]|nr:GNAT family N-acetyltransferase [Terriglobales bacterium]